MQLPTVLSKVVCNVLIVCQVGLLFHNIAYAAPANTRDGYNTRVDGYNMGMAELGKAQNNAKNFSVSQNGDIHFGNERLDSMVDEQGRHFNTKQLSPDQNDPEVEKKFYSSGKAPDIGSLQGLHGNIDEDQLEGIAHDTQEGLEDELTNESNDSSYEAQIHGVLNDIYNNSDPTFENDPALDSIRGVIGGSSTGNPFTDCEIDKQIIGTKKTVHNPELVKCLEQKTDSCTIQHNPKLAILKYSNEESVYGICGENCVTYYIGKFPYDSNDPLKPGACEHKTIETKFQLVDKKSIKNITIETASYAGSLMVYMPAKQGGDDRILFAYNSNGDPILNSEQLDCSSATGANTTYPQADITDLILNNYKEGDVITFATQYKGAIPYSALNITYDPNKVAKDDVWTGSNQCLLDAQAIHAGELQGSVTCKNDILSENGTVIISGVQLDPKYLDNSFGLSGSCTLADVKVTTDNIGDGDNIGNMPLCSELEKKGCGFVSSRCLKYGSDNLFKKACLIHQNTYDCGYENDIEVPKEQEEYKCPGAVACMGTDCLNIVIGKENGADDFNKALGILQQSQGAANDMSCTATGEYDESGNQVYDCRIFPGEKRTCNNWDIVGLGNNCCSGAPVAGDWAQTTRQTLHLAKQSFVKFETVTEDFLGTMFDFSGDTAGLLDGAQAYGTVWDLVKNFTPIGKIENAIMEPITNALNNLFPHAGEIFKGVVYYAQDTIITFCMNEYILPAMQGVLDSVLGSASSGIGGDWTTDKVAGAIKDKATGMLKDMGMSEATAQSAVTFVGNVITVVGWVYAAYSIAKLVVGLLTECEDEEFELQSQIMQKNCDFVGSWCAEDIPLIGCVKDKSAYCCFTSPLSRILNKQIKYGLNGCYRLWPGANPVCAFGYGDYANCSAVTLEQMQKVDWTQIDMTEWLELLKASGALQSDNLSLDKITKNALPVGGYDSHGNKINY